MSTKELRDLLNYNEDDKIKYRLRNSQSVTLKKSERKFRNIINNRNTKPVTVKKKKVISKNVKSKSTSDDESDYLPECEINDDDYSETKKVTKITTKNQKTKTVTPIKLKKVRNTWEIDPEKVFIHEFEVKLTLMHKGEVDVMQEDLDKENQILERRRNNRLMKLFPKLHTSLKPDVLLGREQQISKIKNFITFALSPKAHANNRSIYISGVPGTGKTASVLKAIEDLNKKKRFTTVYVNGLELPQPGMIFVKMYGMIHKNSKKISIKTAREKLSKQFNTKDSNRPPVVLIVDELDMIITKKQDIVYDIFDWSSAEHSKLIVIAIANTLDLPERTLKQRVSSRLGFHREVFEPYSFQEIENILKHRIGEQNLKYFDKGFLMLISRKVAAISGDLRKALEMVRRGIEIAVENDEQKLTSNHAQKVWKETQLSLPVIFVRSLCYHQLIFLKCIIQEMRSTGYDDVELYFVYRNYRLACLNDGEDPFTMTDAVMIVESLEQSGFLDLRGSEHVNRKITLNNSPEEVESWIKTAAEMDNENVNKL